VRLTRVIALMLAIGSLALPVASAQDMAMPNASPTAPGRINIPEPLMVTLQATPGYGSAPLLVGFIVSAFNPSGAEIVGWNWNFGDGHLSNLPPTLAYNTYTNPGSYVATVTVTTADGHSATGFTGVVVKSAAGATQQQPANH